VRRLIALVVILSVVLGLGVLPAGAESAQANVIISFDRKPGPDEQAIIHRFGGTVKHVYSIIPAIAATLPSQAIEALQRAPGILRVEPDVEVHALAEIDATWGVKQIGAGAVHPYNKGTGVKVAIIDSGMDYTHPDLAANYAGGYDWVNDDGDPMDDNGHGSHVAGTIAAAANGTGVVGVAPEASIYALKVLDKSGSGYFSDIVAALQWCMRNGIQVTNNSYGSSGDPGVSVKTAFENAYAAGIIHIAAAGNSGTKPGTGDNVIYPAKYSFVVAVAATDSSKVRASFSSTGPAVEIAAPGVSIFSTVPGGYAYYSGTSMASPHVAGTAALVIKSGVTTPDAIRQRLQTTADDLGTIGKDTWYGHGLVDADEAAPPALVGGIPAVTINSPASGASFHVKETITFSGTARDVKDGDLSGSLVWASNLDGSLGAGAEFTHALNTEGQHTITAAVTDSDRNTGSASTVIRVVNDAPTIQITAPDDGATFASGGVASFTGTATDTEDGTITDDLRWYVDDMANPFGSAGSASVAGLPDGTHLITARAADSTNKEGSASIHITIGTPVPVTYKVGSVTYAAEGGRGGTAHLKISVLVTNGSDAPVAGATVSISVTRNGSPYYAGSAVTGTNGIAAFKLTNAAAGTYTTTVTTVVVGGVTYTLNAGPYTEVK